MKREGQGEGGAQREPERRNSEERERCGGKSTGQHVTDCMKGLFVRKEKKKMLISPTLSPDIAPRMAVACERKVFCSIRSPF